MSHRKSLKRTLIASTALISGGLLIPASALAVSCPSTVSGAALSSVICDFDTGNSVTVDNGAELGGINQLSYNPASSFIINNGTISNTAGFGLYFDNSSLTNGLSNTGLISSTADNGIYIDNGSSISGGISNTGSITSQDYTGLWVNGGSTLNGGITNSGSIISYSSLNPAIVINNSSIVNGDVNNSGVIRADGTTAGLLMNSNGVISGNFINSGSIIGGDSGLHIRDLSIISGNISNTGSIAGGTDDGIRILNTSTIDGNIANSATISGGNSGVSVDGFSTVNGGILNQAGATISGGVNGIYINDASIVNGGIDNRGTVTGGVYGMYVSADSTVNSINLYGGSRVIGALDAVSTTVDILGDFRTEGTMSANVVNINSGSLFTMANAITVQNVLTNAGRLAVGTTTQNVTGDYIQSTGGRFDIDLQNTTSYGQLAVTGTADLSQSGAINVNILNGATISRGDVFSNVFSAGALVGPSGGFTVADNSRLLNFAGAVNGGTGVNLTAVDDAATSVALSNAARRNNGGAGTAGKLDDIIASNPGGDWQNIFNALDSFTTDQQIADAVNQTSPVLMGATNAALMETIGNATRIVQARQESASGLSAGQDFLTHRNLWLKTFGSWGDQGNADGVVGYDAKSYGLITGADKPVTDNARVGAAVSYFNSALSGNGNKVDVDSYLATMYGSYNLDESTEANAQITAGYNNSDSTRNINFGGLNRTAKGSYDGWDFHAGAGLGRSVTVNNDTTITPQIRMDYVRVSNAGYDESGAGVLNLSVDSQTQDRLMPAVEVKANHTFTPGLSLALNTGLSYDLLKDRNRVSASFAGGGGTFVTRGLESSPWAVRSGAGLSWKHSSKLDFTFRYDREDRSSEYDNQTLSLKLQIPL